MKTSLLIMNLAIDHHEDDELREAVDALFLFAETLGFRYFSPAELAGIQGAEFVETVDAGRRKVRTLH